MLLEYTIAQLDIGPVPPEHAKKLGQLGYLQWLGALPDSANYRNEAMRAYRSAQPFRRRSPAVAAFCDILVESTGPEIRPLHLSPLAQGRQGGARARRIQMGLLG